MIALLALLACSDPELDPFRDALSDYDKGQEAVTREDWPGAMAAFSAALDDHPNSPSLHLWLAHAQAQTGDLDAARVTLDQGISRSTGSVDLRYNRAAYAARAGDLDAAARDLQYLYARQLLDPVLAGEDTDFLAMSADPRYATLAPPPQVELEVSAPEPTVLRGEVYALDFALRSRTGRPITVAAPATPGALRHQRTVEDIIGEAEGWSVRRVNLSWAVTEAGQVSIGPVDLTAHGSTARIGPLPVEGTLLPGQVAGPVPADGLPTPWLPSALLAGREAPWAGRLDDGRLAVMFLPGMKASFPGAGQASRLELREQGQVVWQALIAATEPNVEVVMSRGGREVSRERVP